MLKVYAKKSRGKDVKALLGKLRAIDNHEIICASGVTADFALKESFILSDRDNCFTGYIDNKPFCMFGVVRTSCLSDVGNMWLLSTDDIERKDVRLAFLYGSAKYVSRMKQNYSYLTNHVHADNKIALNWLKWLGAKFDKEERYGYLNELFVRFQIN